MIDMLSPVTRQAVRAILGKHHTPAKKIKDRISWHWWAGFRVASEQGKIVVFHETEFNDSSALMERKIMLAKYKRTLDEYGVVCFVTRGVSLCVVGKNQSRPNQPSPDSKNPQGRLF